MRCLRTGCGPWSAYHFESSDALRNGLFGGEIRGFCQPQLKPLKSPYARRWNRRGHLFAMSVGAAVVGAIEFGTQRRPVLLVERSSFDYGRAKRMES